MRSRLSPVTNQHSSPPPPLSTVVIIISQVEPNKHRQSIFCRSFFSFANLLLQMKCVICTVQWLDNTCWEKGVMLARPTHGQKGVERGQDGIVSSEVSHFVLLQVRHLGSIYKLSYWQCCVTRWNQMQIATSPIVTTTRTHHPNRNGAQTRTIDKKRSV